MLENLIFYGRRCERGKYERELDYYLVEENISEEYTDMIRYGIRIEQTVLYPGGGKTIDMRQLNNVFYSYDEANAFMRQLMNETAVPESLRNRVESYITHKMRALR